MATGTSTRQTRRRAPSRTIQHRYKPIKVGRRRWLKRGLASLVCLAVIWAGWGALARRFAPTANTSRNHFDAIVVLGSPADADGNPTPEELSRVSEAVREYERGVAPRLILSGGPAHNSFVEAEVMARIAAARGIPPSAIFTETRARDTIQNACYSERLMQAHGWRSAEVVSSGYHLPRAGLIFQNTDLQWRTHAAPPLEPGESDTFLEASLEVLKTMRFLAYARWTEHCEP